MDRVAGYYEEKDKYCMWNLESTTKVANKTKMRQTHRYREQTSAYQWGEEREVGKHSRSFF